MREIRTVDQRPMPELGFELSQNHELLFDELLHDEPDVDLVDVDEVHEVLQMDSRIVIGSRRLDESVPGPVVDTRARRCVDRPTSN